MRYIPEAVPVADNGSRYRGPVPLKSAVGRARDVYVYGGMEEESRGSKNISINICAYLYVSLHPLNILLVVQIVGQAVSEDVTTYLCTRMLLILILILIVIIIMILIMIMILMYACMYVL